MQKVDLAHSLKLFELIGLESQTDETLRSQYRHLAKKYHPDTGGSAEEFIYLRQCYIFLKNKLQDPAYKTKNKYNFQTGNNPVSFSDKYSESDFLRDKLKRSENEIQDFNIKLERFEQGFVNLMAEKTHYEEIMNQQIQIINQAKRHSLGLVEAYEVKKSKNTRYYKEKFAKLSNQHKPVNTKNKKDISEYNDDYIDEHNNLVDEYRESTQGIENEFHESVVKAYQMSFNEIMRLVEF